MKLAYGLLFVELCLLKQVLGQKFSNCPKTGYCYQVCDFGSKCDTLPPIDRVSAGQIIMFQTSAYTGDKWAKHLFNFYDTTTDDHKESAIGAAKSAQITVNSSVAYQKIAGIGGAVTDATTINLAAAGAKTRAQILEAYYSLQKGSGYSVARVPMASCDFSPHSYTWAAVTGDMDLRHFALDAEFDTGPNGKIPFLKEAKQLAASSVKVFASPWTAPPWMKVDTRIFTKGGWIGGKLNSNRSYWRSYARYFAKFVDAYYVASGGQVAIDAVTVQNEPLQKPDWESMHWSPAQMGEFVAEYLGPTLAKASAQTARVKIWIHDDQKFLTPLEIKDTVNYPNAAKYISGVGLHWYVWPPPVTNCLVCTGAFDHVASLRKFLDSVGLTEDKCSIIATEACTGSMPIISPPAHGPDLGSWQRGRQYVEDVIGDMLVGAVQWTDWNMALSVSGGPNHAGNVCDAPILVDAAKGRYFKQPMYYMLAHLSRFLQPGSRRVWQQVEGTSKNLWALSARTGDSKTVLVLLNANTANEISLRISDHALGSFRANIPPNTVQTYYWNTA